MKYLYAAEFLKIVNRTGLGQTYFFSKKVGLTQACPVVVFKKHSNLLNR